METAKLRKTWNIVSRNSLIWNSPPGLEIQAPFLCQKWDISFFQVLFQTTKFLTVCDYGEQGFLSTSEIRKRGHPKNGVIMTPFSCIMSFREIWKEVLVAQSCLTPCNPMDCSPPGSSVHEIPGKNTRVGWHSLLQGTFPTQGSNLSLPHCRQILYCLSHQGSPCKNTRLEGKQATMDCVQPWATEWERDLECGRARGQFKDWKTSRCLLIRHFPIHVVNSSR